MNIKTIIAAVVALTASPLALASGHTMEFYVGGDLGQVSLNDHSEACDNLRNFYVAATTDTTLNITVAAASATVNLDVILPAANSTDTTGSPARQASCEDTALAPRIVVGYKINDMFSVEGFFSWASGFDAVVNATPKSVATHANTAGVSADYLEFDEKYELEYTSLGLVLNGQYEVSRGIMVGGKIGIQRSNTSVTQTMMEWKDDKHATDTALNTRIDNVRAGIEDWAYVGETEKDKTEAIYGIGAAYQVTDELSVRAGYDLSGESNYMHGGVTYSLSF